MTEVETRFALFASKMKREGLPPIVVENFRYYFSQLVSGETGMLPESTIAPVTQLPDAEDLGEREQEIGHIEKQHTVLLKLNGGLGTSMGLEKAKSLLVVKEGLTFLDIIARQSIRSGFPLLLMNSFVTQEDSLTQLAAYPELERGMPLDFLQHKVPKIESGTLRPASFPADPDLEWCPPGHGDIYTALTTTGMLTTLLNHGIRYAFVSNSDNLGAVLDERILGFFVSQKIPFMMEVADRTPADRKGGHLALQQEKGQTRFVLRESAQCPDEDMDAFQDIDRHRFFNTNNLWIDLQALKALLDETGGYLRLSLIRNAKTVNPREASSTPVYQLETAMGAAISVFDGAQGLRVPRRRFSPVKTCDDLLRVRSDATVLDEEFRVIQNPEREGSLPLVKLDPRYYKLVSDMEARFPEGPPSMIHCQSLVVEGDVTFGAGVVLEGAVEIQNSSGGPAKIEPGSVLSGRILI
ncbi:MAG: UTP--glucose-1-phosphate uridylyltransferase [Acidobacteriota bacterium]|nr:MAG: UTP--glucose-1-phosphate uridylyltransferase [Acidobacteriota bacterium]